MTSSHGMENRLLPLPAQPKRLHYNVSASSVPHHIRRNRLEGDHPLLLKVTHYGQESEPHSPQLTRFDDDTCTGSSPYRQPIDLERLYAEMRERQRQEQSYPLETKTFALHRSFIRRKPRARQASFDTTLQAIRLSPQRGQSQQVGEGWRVSRYTIKENAKYLNLRRNQASQESQQPELVSKTGTFSAVKFQTTKKDFTRIPCRPLECFTCFGERTEEAVPQRLRNGTLKQLALLSHLDFNSESRNVPCFSCGLRAMTWCPNCRRAYCFCCWDLVQHRNSSNSEDALNSHFRALAFTDADYIALSSETSCVNNQPTHRAHSRSGLRSGLSSSRRKSSDRSSRSTGDLLAAFSIQNIQSPVNRPSDEPIHTFNDEFQDTLSTASSSNGKVKHLINSLAYNLSTEIDPNSIHDDEDPPVNKETSRYIHRDGFRVVLPMEFAASGDEELPILKNSSPKYKAPKMQVIRGKILRVVDK